MLPMSVLEFFDVMVKLGVFFLLLVVLLDELTAFRVTLRKLLDLFSHTVQSLRFVVQLLLFLFKVLIAAATPLPTDIVLEGGSDNNENEHDDKINPARKVQLIKGGRAITLARSRFLFAVVPFTRVLVGNAILLLGEACTIRTHAVRERIVIEHRLNEVTDGLADEECANDGGTEAEEATFRFEGADREGDGENGDHTPENDVFGHVVRAPVDRDLKENDVAAVTDDCTGDGGDDRVADQVPH